MPGFSTQTNRHRQECLCHPVDVQMLNRMVAQTFLSVPVAVQTDMEGASTLARPEVARLIDEAIARNPVPFASAGRGSMVIRSTSAKKRQQGRSA